MFKKTASSILAVALLAGSLSTAGAAGVPDRTGALDFTINNPYASVDWDTYGQYKADFHAHSNESDGSPMPADTIEEHYKKGYDILALTDHNVTNTAWDRTDDPTGLGRTYLTSERLQEITYGADRDGRGMVAILNSDEQSVSDHLNSFFTPFNNAAGATLESNIAAVEALGGISHINHPGRYTGGSDTSNNGATGEAASKNPATIQKYVDLFMKYNSCVGMEIINKLDGDSYSDRILWDGILQETMPQGRFVWGFSNDDTHSNAATGHSYNMMLMPTNNPTEVRKAMENGTFYASAKVAKREGYTITDYSVINDYQPPIITDISVDQDADTITIQGDYYNEVEWIADGEVIATGNTIDLNDYEGVVNSYVRAQLKGDEGISFTQPFGITAKNTGSAILDADKVLAVVEKDDSVTLTVSAKNVSNLNSFDVAVSYDQDVFEVSQVKSLLNNTTIAVDKSTQGTARMILGTTTPVSGDVDVMEVVLNLKDNATLGDAEFTLTAMNTAGTTQNGTFESPVAIADGSETVRVISYRENSDINEDGAVTLADLSIALSNYQTSNADCDIDASGVVDTADLIILTGYIA